MRSPRALTAAPARRHRAAMRGARVAVLGMVLAATAWSAPAFGAVPVNDDFADATVFSLADASPLTGTNVGATHEPDEPYVGGWGTPSASVWWRFTATAPGTVELTTEGSDFDSLLAVFTGASLTDLSMIGTDDNEPFGDYGRVPFSVTKDTTYHVLVDGSHEEDTGSIVLNFTFTASDGPAQSRGTIAVESPPGTPVGMINLRDDIRPEVLDFGTVAVGAAATRTVVVRNVGEQPLDILGVELDMRSFADGEYSVVDDTASGATIPPGESRHIVVEFAPMAGYEGAPAPVSRRESLADWGLLLQRGYVDDGVIVGRRMFTYVHNTGGSGSVGYRAATSHWPTSADGYVDGDEKTGTSDLLGGEYYAVETATRMGTTSYETALDVFLGTAFHDRTVLEPTGSSTLSAMGSIDGVSFHRLEDALLNIRSSDPDAQGDVDPDCPDCVPLEPRGTFVSLLGRAKGGSTTGDVARWAGADRYATAAVASARTFPGGAEVAFVATGANFPDALAGGPAGGLLGGPILLTSHDALPQATVTELQRLGVRRIVVLGGSGAVSDAVVAQLGAFAPAGVTRWAGADRYATAAVASARTFPGGAEVAFVATGANFPDALAGGPAGGLLGGPILLTSHDALPQATVTELQRLGVRRIVVLGGSGAVSDAVVAQLRSHVQ